MQDESAFTAAWAAMHLQRIANESSAIEAKNGGEKAALMRYRGHIEKAIRSLNEYLLYRQQPGEGTTP